MADNSIFKRLSRDNNMPVIRYILSICILTDHVALLANVDLPITLYVGGFFTISGFLIFTAFQKDPVVKSYAEKRVRRLFPPYCNIVLMCALLMVFISSLNWWQYYSDLGFWEYLGSNLIFLNFLHPTLPGVFEGSQYVSPAVNGALWTMKGEIVCYIIVPILYIFMSKSRKRALSITSVIIVVCYALSLLLHHLHQATGREIWTIIERQFSTIVIYFFLGALINLLFDKFMKYKWPVLIITLLVIIFNEYYSEAYHLILRPIAISVLVIWFSMVGKWGAFMRNHEDLSYDIYLFHWPMIQLAVYLGLPQMMNKWLLLLVILTATAGLAFLSWNLVGKRFSYNKKKISIVKN